MYLAVLGSAAKILFGGLGFCRLGGGGAGAVGGAGYGWGFSWKLAAGWVAFSSVRRLNLCQQFG